jgi:hypothetical protein
MAAITDLSDAINRATGGNSGTPEIIHVYKDARVGAAAATAPIAGRWLSLLEYNGNPAHGIPPTTVAYPDNTLNGSLKQTDPGGGRTKWLTGGCFFANTPGTIMLYDRLSHIGGLNGTTTTAQTVAATPTRYTGSESVGNQIWLEIYTIIGTTATTIDVEYTDQDGNTAITSPVTAIGGTGLREAQRMIQMPLASGDTGVRACQDCDLVATTGTAGNFGVTILRPLAYFDIAAAATASIQDFMTSTTMGIEIKTDACLCLAFMANTTVIPYVHGNLAFIGA